MTNQEKLQQLFNAALKSQPEDYTTPPAKLRAVPTPASVAVPAAGAASRQAVVVDSVAAAEETPRGLSITESGELGALLDEQNRRRRRRHRMEALVASLVLLGMTAGGLAWFVQDPSRVQAFQEAMRDIRSVGDIKTLVASYQDSLDRISARSNHIHDASKAMGIDPSKCADEDPYFEEEMREMMGEEGGQTVGTRNQRLSEKFGDMARKSNVEPANDFDTREAANADSFDWNR